MYAKGLNTMPDGSCRTIKYQYQKNSISNFESQGSFGATGVIRKMLDKGKETENALASKQASKDRSAASRKEWIYTIATRCIGCGLKLSHKHIKARACPIWG